jgi:uncharacterized membrane protein YhhN
MFNSLIIIAALALLGGLLYFEKRGNPAGVLLTKAPLSALFILAAALQPQTHRTYYFLLLAGLGLCLVGDICLVFSRRIMFLTGLIVFLLGHVFYSVAFFHLSQTNSWIWVAAAGALIAGTWIYGWLKPHLGSLKVPVLLYIFVISLMVFGACSVAGDVALVQRGRFMVLIGAVLFYFSDIFVARNRFIKKEYLNRLCGLPLYYCGQFLLAFSIGSL